MRKESNLFVKKDFVNCRTLIYDEDGAILANVKILDHDSNENTIKVQNLPALDGRKKCELLVLTAPKPYTYKGTIHKTSVNKSDSGRLIRLYQEQEAENRKEPRYSINMQTNIEGLIFDDTVYDMHTPLAVELINISKSGMRLRSKYNALAIGNRFHVNVRISGSDTMLTAEVTNITDSKTDYSEFGCYFVDIGN